MEFDKHGDIVQARSDAQEVDSDRREIMREVNAFITMKGGQWEREVWEKFEQFKRPRYTFDRCKPIRNQIWGAIADQEFAIKVKPMGAGASDDVAETYSGLVRNIESMSVATDVYEQAIKKGIDIGFGCWRIEQDWADADAFDQDLFIRPVHNAVDRVWFLGYFESPVAEDAEAVTIDHTISLDEYKQRFGDDRNPQALGEDRSHSTYYYKREGILIAELIYKEKITKMLYMTPDGDVVDEKKAQELGLNLDELKSRERETFKIMTRFYDGGGWLTEPEETVFDHLPVVPVWPNFEITDNKVITCGAIEWLMDEQRVHNYAVSRAVEDVALSPKPKLMMTRKQAKGSERSLASMNQNNEPVLFYNHDESAPAQPYPLLMQTNNAALAEIINLSAQATEASSGLYGPNLARNEGIQSGVAIEKQQHKGDIGTIEYFKAVKRSIIQTGKILIHAIPKVYEQGREVRIMNEDGTYDIVSIHEQKITEEDGVVTYNDLSQGIYDVTCDIGPSYGSRQEQSADFFERIGQIDPSIVEQGKDIWLQTMGLPGMDVLAERFRAQLLQAGVIPPDQYTDEEREAAEVAAQQPQPPDPNQIIAEAEAAKAQAQQNREEIRSQTELIKAQQAQQKMDFEEQKQMIELQIKQMETEQKGQREQVQTSLENQAAQFDMLKTMAETLNLLRDAMGAEAVVSPSAAGAYEQQAQLINQEQR